MADEQIVTNIVANADFSNLIADVHRVTNSLSQLQEKIGSTNKSLSNKIAEMNRSFSDTLRSTGQYSTHFVSLTSDVEKFGKNLDGGRLKLRDYFRTWQEHTKTSGGLIRDLAKQQVQLQNSILQPLGRNAQGLMQFNVQVPRGLDAVKNRTALVRQELQIMNKVIQDGGVQLINWGKNTQWAGRQLTVGLTVPMVAFGKAAADAFKLADQELTRLTKVYGDIAGTSAAELAKVRKEVSATSKELASAYGVNFQETIGLAADIAATGKQGNELLASVKETTRLAVLGEVDRQEAMKATLAIQSAFKQNTDELSESINFLNAVENQTSTTLADLVEAIPKAGPVIQGLGGSVQDLALYLTAMREGGINASEGANALKSGLASLINPTKVATEKFRTLGIDLLGIVNNNAGNVTGTLLELQKALDNLDPLQKQQAIEQLFGKFQFSRLNALFENLGKQGSQTLQVLDLMKASSSDLASIAGRELTAVTESASGKYRRAIESLRADLATIGEQFLNIATKVITFVDRIIGVVDGLPKPIKQALALVGALTALAGPVIMLTGVLANFFGYIIKGLGHFKALFKGGEGFKLLTPEILAAQKAGTMLEQTFYSDADAAKILSTAVHNLNTELLTLQQRVESGQISATPVFNSVQNGLATVGGPRVVDPNHPLAGDLNRAPRASAHMNPRDPGDPATIFGLVPGAEPVNRKIGRTPQIYMNERLPNVEGLTSVGGVSTGVVAGEAARYHALMATLGMQSKAEIEALKKTIAAGGAISTDFIATFDDILPLTQRLTQNAAAQSAQIVAELRQGKLTVDQAKAQIISLNAQIEAAMGAEVTAYATSAGRAIDLTKAPLIDQAVVNQAGKSNLRGMFRKGIFGRVMSAAGRATRTRTYGAPYNIETTKPSQFSKGVTSVGVPGYAGGVVGAGVNLGRAVAQRLGLITGRSSQAAYKFKSAFGVFGKSVPGRTREQVNALLEQNKMPTSEYISSLMAAGGGRVRGGADSFISALSANGLIDQQTEAYLMNKLSDDYLASISGRQYIGDSTNPYAAISNKVIGMEFKNNPEILSLWKQFSRQSPAWTPLNKYRSTSRKNIVLNLNGQRIVIDKNEFKGSASGDTTFLHGTNAKNWGRKLGQYQDGVTRLPGYGGGDIIPAMLEPGESVVTKQATAGNESAIAYMNAGGKIPGFKNGVAGVGSSYMQGLRNPIGGGIVRGGIGPMGMGSQMAIGMGGMVAGQMVGGQAGNAIMLASNMIPMLSLLKGFGGAAPMVTKLAGLLGRLTIPGAVIGSLALGVKLLLDWKKRAEEAGKANRLSFGGTSETLAEVGLKYTTIADKLKAVNEQLALQKAKGLEAYAALTNSGVPGLTLTIKELTERIKRAKTQAKETVGAFNAIDSSKVSDLAASLKQQYISAGMSVQEATNEIYAIIKASDKADQALSAITTKAFSGIKDKATAAQYSVQALGETLGDKNLFNSEEFARGVDNMLNSIESYRQSLVGTKTGDSTVTQADALKMTLDEIKKIKGANKTLDDAALIAIKQQDIMMGAVLGKTETLASVYAKMALLQAGFGGNIVGLTGQQAIQAAQGMQAYQDSVVKASEETSGPLGTIAIAYNKLKVAADKTSNASKKAAGMTSDAIDAEIKKRQKLIDSLKKEEEARLAVLDAQEKSADFNVSIQQAQIRYQEALAAGDMAQAAQEQLNIEKISGDRQKELARAAIQDKYEKQIEKLQIEIENLQDKKDAQSKSVAAAQTSATNALAKQQAIASYRSRLVGLAQQNPDPSKLTDAEKKSLIGQVKTIFDEMSKEGGVIAEAAKALKKQFETGSLSPGVAARPKSMISPELNIISALSKEGFKLAGATEFTTAVEAFGKYVASLPGAKTASSKFVAPKDNEKNNFFIGYDTSYMVFTKDGASYQSLEQSNNWKDAYAAAVKAGYQISYSKEKAKGIKDIGNYSKLPGIKKAMGGKIAGPGSGTSDSIPALLSNGEYVIKADSVNKYGVETFDALNAGRYAAGGPANKNGWLQKWAKSLSGMPAAEMFGTAALLRKIAGIGQKGDTLSALSVPLNFAGSGAFKSLASPAVSAAYKPINLIKQYNNYFKAKNLLKQGMYHGDALMSLSGRSVLDGTPGKDPHFGMGFFATSNIDEAERYAQGYATGIDAYGPKHQVSKIPFGRYIDFNKPIKSQSYDLWKMLGGKNYAYAGPKLGGMMNKIGAKGSMMPGIVSGMNAPRGKWLALNKPKGTVLNELNGFARGGLVGNKRMNMGGPVYDIPAYSMGGRVKYNAGGMATSSNALYNINVTLNGTDMNPNDVAKAIDQQMRMREAMNGRGRNI